MSARAIAIAFAIPVLLSQLAGAQAVSPSNRSSSPRTVTANYPIDRVGTFILVKDLDWRRISAEPATRVRVRRGFSNPQPYGTPLIASVKDVLYGVQGRVQASLSRPIICICQVPANPENPMLVRLHSFGQGFELDGSKLHFGTKFAAGKENDLLPVNVSRPQPDVWLIQPRQALPPGDYGLITKSRTAWIFHFSVVSPASLASRFKH